MNLEIGIDTENGDFEKVKEKRKRYFHASKT